jgi:hypothetical protein
MTAAALPPVVDADSWQRQLDALRAREKAATRELDAIAAQRRRLPMVKMPTTPWRASRGRSSPEGWPRSPTCSRWSGSEQIAAAYGPDT